jgi:hypothetical protein
LTFKRGINAIKEREWPFLSPKIASQQPWLQQPLFPKQTQLHASHWNVGEEGRIREK